MLITRALMAHNAARIKARLIWTRDARTSLQMAAAGVTFDAATNSYYKAPAPDARPEDDAPLQTARHTSLLPPPPPAAKRPRITDSEPPSGDSNMLTNEAMVLAAYHPTDIDREEDDHDATDNDDWYHANPCDNATDWKQPDSWSGSWYSHKALKGLIRPLMAL